MAIVNSVFCQAKCRGRSDKPDLNDHLFRGSNEFQSNGFVGNTAIARGERQRIADVFGGGRDVEQQSGFARIGLLGKVQPEHVIPERLRRVLKKLALRQSGDAMATTVNIAFRDAGAIQQRGYRNLAFAKDGDRLPSGEARGAW